MNINKQYAQTKFNVTLSGNRSVKYIVVHYTGTDASAANNCIYFGGGNRNASADFFIDKNGAVYQFNGDIRNYYSWHCGDGGGKYGITNANSIGIEVVSSGAEFTQAQKDSLRELVAALRAQCGVSAQNVVRHYDASRKSCPAPYAGDNNQKWNALHAYITAEEEIVTPQDKQDIVNMLLNTVIDGQTVAHHILYGHRDSEWLRNNGANAVWSKGMKLKHGNTTMTAQDVDLWTEYNTAALYSYLPELKAMRAEIAEIKKALGK